MSETDFALRRLDLRDSYARIVKESFFTYRRRRLWWPKEDIGRLALETAASCFRDLYGAEWRQIVEQRRGA